MQLAQAAAEKILSDMGMGDLPLVQVTPTACPLHPDWFRQYKELCRKFIMSLTDSISELAFMNIGQDAFMELLMGRSIPPNLSLRMRVPLVWGGKMEIDNMFMCYTFPHSNNMDRFIITQANSPTIWMPNPAKKIYLPAHTANGGDGGNATEDRLAQMAAQMAAGRGME